MQCGLAEKLAAGFVACWVIVSIFLIAFSFHRLSENEVGFDYNAASKTVNVDKLYTSNLYFLGVSHEFIRFPKNVQEISLRGSNRILARTKDGLIVRLEASFTFALTITKEALAALYFNYRLAYKDVFALVAQSVIRDAVSDYDAIAFYESRPNVTNSIAEALDAALRDMHASVNVFALNSFELPEAFRAAITATEVANQEIERVSSERLAAETQRQTNILKAREDAKIVELRANATAQAILLGVGASVSSIRSLVTAEIDAYSSLKTNLNLTNSELISYIWLDTLRKSSSEKLLYVSKPPLVEML